MSRLPRPGLAEVLPDLARELHVLLQRQGRDDLGAQVPNLEIVDRCRCNDDFCATIYTAPPPHGAWGPGHEDIDLDPDEGYLVLDVVDKKIRLHRGPLPKPSPTNAARAPSLTQKSATVSSVETNTLKAMLRFELGLG